MTVGRCGLLGIMLVALLAPSVASGQARFGVYGGLGISTLGGSDVSGWHSRNAAQAGGFVNLPLSRVLTIRPGLAWTGKGAKDEFEDITATFVLQYFEISALGQFTLPSTSIVEAHAIIGPVVGFEFRCDVKVANQYGGDSAECDSPLLQGGFQTRSNDLGLLFGGGVTIAPRNRLSALLEVAYTLGLTSIDASSPSYDVKNRSFAIRAGLMFSLAG